MIRLNPFGIDIFCQGKKFLTYNLVSRNLKIKYRRSFLGFFWSLLVPLGTAGVYFVVFKMIMKIQIANYLVYILSGILPWTFFSITLNEGMDSIVGNASILTKVPIPQQVFPLVSSLTNYITLLLSLPVLIIAMVVQQTPVSFYSLFFFYYVFLLFFIAYAFAVLLSVAYVYFRDLRHAFSIIIQLWFYATPVLYRDEMIPDHLRWLLGLNPIGYIFVGIHRTLVDAVLPSPDAIFIPLCWTAGLFFLALLVLRKFSSGLVEIL